MKNTTSLIIGAFIVLTAVGAFVDASREAVKSWSIAEAEKARAATQAQIARDNLGLQVEALTVQSQVAGRQVAFIGAGVAVAVTLVGLAFAFVTWSALQAATIRPNAAGQFPLVRVGGFGWAGLVDPNRSTGLTVFKTPTVFDQAGDVIARLQGRGPSLPGPEVSSPLALTEGGHVALTAQASALAMTVAATRWPDSSSAKAKQIRDTVATVAARSIASPLPAVEDEDPDHIDRLLLLTGEVIED